MPITVINGAQPGPVLALVAGTHGMEYTPIVALQRLRAAIDPKTLAGTVIMVHVANMPSLPRAHDLLLAGRRQEPQSRVPRQGRRHALGAHRRRHHPRGDRARHARRRPALRRRQRVAAAVSATGSRPATRRSPRPARRWPSPSAWTTSSSTASARPIRRRRSICRTPRSRAASRR